MNVIRKSLAIVMLIVFAVASYAAGPEALSKGDLQYLQGVYKATLQGIAHYVHIGTGLPYDVSDGRKATSISNIGLYMASVAIGSSTGLLSSEDAINEIDKTLTSLEKIEKWNGFPITWVNVETLQREFGPSFSYADHVGNLVCGLLVVESVFPDKFKARIEAFLSPMDFGSAYDPATGWLKGGYNLDKKDFDIQQSWGKWYYNLLASDVRPFSLLGITRGQIPPEHWNKLFRNTAPAGAIDKEFFQLIEKSTGTKVYYAPGMEGGGLFMQYLPRIFLSEENLPMGESSRVLARAQLEFSRMAGYLPFWGVSACETPDGKGYLGWGSLKKNVVTPHASVLAIADFPRETVANLKALEKKGMRPIVTDDIGRHDYGFTDAYDIDSETASEHYLCLDQCMLFLSLANFLYGGTVQAHFANTELGKAAIERLQQLERGRKLR